METILAFVIGALYATGLYLMLRRNIVRLILGLGLITNAANLLIFTMGGLTRGQPAILSGEPGGPGEIPTVPEYADPLPQAMILTAIVIGFGMMAFALVLGYRAYQTVGTDDLDDLKATDR